MAKSTEQPRSTREQDRSGAWRKAIASCIGGLVLAGGITACGEANNSDGAKDRQEADTSITGLDATTPDKEAISVDGNQYPEKANGVYDKTYGIYNVGNDGKIDVRAIGEQIGIVDNYKLDSHQQGWDLTRSKEDLGDSDDWEIISERNTIINEVYVPNVEAAINAFNMNNPIVQMARASKIEDTDKSLLLENADLQNELRELFTYNDINTGKGVGFSRETIDAIIESSPQDASLRATVCKTADGSKQLDVCAKAEEMKSFDNKNFSQHTIYVDNTNSSEITSTSPEGSDVEVTAENYWARHYNGQMTVSVVWTNAAGEIVDTQTLGLETRFSALGVVPGDEISKKTDKAVRIG